jgi:hypothetical protein
VIQLRGRTDLVREAAALDARAAGGRSGDGAPNGGGGGGHRGGSSTLHVLVYERLQLDVHGEMASLFRFLGLHHRFNRPAAS